MAKKIWYLQQLDLFKGLPTEKMKTIDELFFMKEYCQGETIFEPGETDRVYIVKTGKVEIYKITEDGKKFIIDILKKGSLFGDLGFEHSYDVFF